MLGVHVCLAVSIPCASQAAFVLELVHGLCACRIPLPCSSERGQGRSPPKAQHGIVGMV